MSDLFLQVWEKVSVFKNLLINCLAVSAKIVHQDNSLQGWEFQNTEVRGCPQAVESKECS